MEITGRIKLITDTQTFGSGFTKRECVITTTDDKYPQDIKLEFIKERCDLLDAYKLGDEVEVSFNIRGNEYNGKYYVQLQGWKIVDLGKHQDKKSDYVPSVDTEELRGDDIPF